MARGLAALDWQSPMTKVEDAAGSVLVPRSRTGGFLCVVGASLGATGLLGHVSGATLLTTIVPGLPPMVPNTALALVLIGVAGAARHRADATSTRYRMSVLASCVGLGIGVSTLLEYALGVDLGIDDVLEGVIATSGARQPSPSTAAALTCLASAVLLLDVRSTARVRPSEMLVLGAAFTAFTGLTGIILGAAPLYRSALAPLIGLSLPTAVSLLLTSVGLLLARPTAGVMSVATSPGPGGILLRRLTFPVIAVPVVVGYGVIRLAATQGIVNVEVPVAILATAMGAISLFVLVVTALPLNHAHEALESSRTQLRNLVAQAPDGIFVADLDGRYVDVNEAGCRLLRCSREEIVGRTIVDFIPPEDVARLWRSRALLLQGHIDVDEWRIRRKDGSYLSVEVSAKILPDGRWQGFVRDVGERKRIEQETRFLAELASALSSTLDCDETLSRIAEVTARHVADFCIVELIDDESEVCRGGVVRGDPSNTRLCDLLQSMMLDGTRPHSVLAALGSQQSTSPCYVSRQGIEALVETDPDFQALADIDLQSAMTVPLVAREKVLGVIGLFSVMPSRIYGLADLRVVRELAQRATLALENARLYRTAQRAIEARDEVLGIVAHDLRDPLSMILMEARLLRTNRLQSDAAGREPAELIQRAASRMNRLIADLLDVTRIEKGQFSIQPSRVLVAQLIADAVEVHRSGAALASIGLQRAESQESLEVWADSDRLLQVFDNLIGNAIKFTAPDGTITIGALAEGDDVRFWVTDTGSGMTAEEAVHVFDRFWQARTARRAGAGLGLSIVKGIVEAHGGRVWVETASGRGTTVFFTIPTVEHIEERSGSSISPATIGEAVHGPEDRADRRDGSHALAFPENEIEQVLRGVGLEDKG
jgi:PAS domain S-box-containing protein